MFAFWRRPTDQTAIATSLPWTIWTIQFDLITCNPNHVCYDRFSIQLRSRASINSLRIQVALKHFFHLFSKIKYFVSPPLTFTCRTEVKENYYQQTTHTKRRWNDVALLNPKHWNDSKLCNCHVVNITVDISPRVEREDETLIWSGNSHPERNHFVRVGATLLAHSLTNPCMGATTLQWSERMRRPDET